MRHRSIILTYWLEHRLQMATKVSAILTKKQNRKKELIYLPTIQPVLCICFYSLLLMVAQKNKVKTNELK